jgi:hypothetical protein
MGDRRFWWGSLRRRDHVENLGVDGRIIRTWIFKRWDEVARTRLI